MTCDEQLMGDWPDEAEIKRNQTRLADALADGSYRQLDGVMSAQTQELRRRFSAAGVDMTILWAMTPQEWACPVCKRAKPDIVRLNKNSHLICRLVEHHDHMQELLKRRFEEISTSLDTVVADQTSEAFAKRSSSMVSAFDNTTVCDDCNVADVVAKKATGANKWFSFSPRELSEIVRPRKNEPHTIDSEVARAHWASNEDTFALRLRIVDRIAEIAATDTHWFQPIDFNYRPAVITRRAESAIARKRAYGVFDLLTGSRGAEQPVNASAWRRRTHKTPAIPPTAQQVEHVARVKTEKTWNSVGENWRCPGCGRRKKEIVKISKKNSWGFSLSTRWYRDNSRPQKLGRLTLCGDCAWVSENLAREARLLAQEPDGPLSSLVEVGEIARVVRPQVNARHNIDNHAAEGIVERIVSRIRQDRTDIRDQAETDSID